MPRYYFHIRDGDTFILDDEGFELADMEAVKIEAFRSAMDLLQRNAAEHFLRTSTPHIAVCDEKGNEVFVQAINLIKAKPRGH
jgi:uncharacterized protein DUF6894